jgi:hypothetical protein
MRRIAVFAIALFVGNSAAQAPKEGAELIASRQPELTRLARVYGIRLESGAWTHHEVFLCPAFSHHVFARFDQRLAAGAATSFLAIYSREVPPAKNPDRPWEGGISLIPLAGPQDLGSGPVVTRQSTITVYNRIFTDEMRSSGHPDELLTNTSDLTTCYLHMAGEDPRVQSETDDADKADGRRSPPISSQLIRLMSNGPDHAPRYVSLQLNANGSIHSAKVISERRIPN